ncbi:MAG: tetratricopeptide repeat protein [Bryobacteraceae bacterium]
MRLGSTINLEPLPPSRRESAIQGIRACVILLVAAVASWSAPCPLVSNINRAERLIHAGLFRNAIDLLEATAARLPACDSDQYRLLAAAWLNLHEPQRALDAADRGLRAFPRSVPLEEYYVTLVAAALLPAERRGAFEHALTLAPNGGPLLKALGRIELELDREGVRAGELLGRAVQAMPRDVEARCYRAEWLLAASREEEALRLLATAYVLSRPLSPDRVSVLRLRAAAADSQNNDTAAGQAYAEAIEIERALPGHPIYAQWEYEQYLLRRDQAAEARELLERIMRDAPRFGPAYFAQAKLFARAGDNAAAVAAARTALELAPGVDEQMPLHAFLSRIYHLMGDEAAAREHEQWINAH